MLSWAGNGTHGSGHCVKLLAEGKKMNEFEKETQALHLCCLITQINNKRQGPEMSNNLKMLKFDSKQDFCLFLPVFNKAKL